MKPAPFDYVAVDTTEQAVAMLVRFGGDARLLAGGQSLVPLLNMRLLRPSGIVDINRIRGLDGVLADQGAVRVGALVRYSTLETATLIGAHLPLIAEALPFIGDRQVRNRGTVGGALSHADPSGELALCAVTLGATLTVVGPSGIRAIPAEEFFRGPYTTALEAVEMLIEVSFPNGGSGAVGAMAEHARRHGDFAVVSVAAAGMPGPGASWRWVRVGLGGVADRPVYARRASDLLSGSALEPEAVRAAAEACLEVAEPSSDTRASAAYRRHLLPIYLERVLEKLGRRRR